MKKSWKTTATGVVAVLTALCGAAQLLLDNDPATMPDWPSVIAAVVAGVGLVMARDNNRTSEDVGAKK